MKIDNKLRQFKEAIAYTTIGAYAAGAASKIVDLDKDISYRTLGEHICTYNRQDEPFNPLNMNHYGTTNPEIVNYLSGLITYYTDTLTEARLELNKSKLAEDKKIAILTKTAKRLSTLAGTAAFSEGFVDDELKADMEIILKESRERFEKRSKEAVNQDAVDIKQDTTLAPSNQMKQNMNQPMDDDLGFNDEVDDDDDLGFGDDFGDFSDPKPDKSENMNTVANDMSKFANYEVNGSIQDKDDTKGESINISNMSIGEIDKLIETYGEAAITNRLIFGNNIAHNGVSRYNIYKGRATTLSSKDINTIVENILFAESKMFEAVSKSEGVSVIKTTEYQNSVRTQLHELCVVEVTKHRLNI